MITKIEVDGFKSLSEFELKLKTGLNILVGPNGAGKTNIILFFEFLSKIASNSIGHSVSSVGGAGSIFKKIGKEKYQDTIRFKVCGSSHIEKNKYSIYEYSCLIKSTFSKDEIFYDYQQIKIKEVSKFYTDPDAIKPNENWDFLLEFKNKGTEKPSLIIKGLDKKNFQPRYFFHGNPKDKDYEREFKDFITQNDPSSRIILTALIPMIEPVRFIYNDIIGGESFNVVPSKVKEQEDAATPPGIKKDGSGLATTLYALKKSKPVVQSDFRLHFYMERNERNYDPKSLKKIISYLKLANKTITELGVENDPFDNRLIVKIFIKTGSYEAVLPLSSMSDGTIKWLTLITAILTSKTIFSIEEPENFLHPWMQAEIAKIMREHIDQKKNHSFIIMTTHSESLLNSSNPEEVILVDLVEGKTSARRISNIQALKEEISQSGFGLGHFYFSDSFQA
jgi:predicted ATPase